MAKPYTRPFAAPQERSVWAPQGMLMLHRAFDLFGELHFGDAWTGTERHARLERFAPAVAPAFPRSAARPDREPDPDPKVEYVVNGRLAFLPHSEAVLRFEAERDELEELRLEEESAAERFVALWRLFRQVMHAGEIPAYILTSYGSQFDLPRRIWASDEAAKCFKEEKASFAAGGYSMTVHEGMVLIPEKAIREHFAGREGEKQDEGTVPARRSAGGRRPEYDWEAFWLQVCLITFNEGLPNTQAEMVRRLSDWFSAEFDKVPAESEIKKRVSKVFRAIGSAENSDVG